MTRPTSIRALASRLVLAAVLCVLPLARASAQSVEMPQTVTAAVGRLASVEMVYDGDDFQFSVPPELDAFREYTTDPNVVKLRVIGYQAGTYQVTAVASKAVDGKGKMSPFKSCIIQVGVGPKPPPVDPEDPEDPPPPTTKAIAATFVYEKDQHAIPVGVLAALNKLNRERGIVATVLEADPDDGTGEVPEQYKVALAAAKQAGLPCLVVSGTAGVIRVVKNPKTEAEVLDAVPASPAMRKAG